MIMGCCDWQYTGVGCWYCWYTGPWNTNCCSQQIIQIFWLGIGRKFRFEEAGWDLVCTPLRGHRRKYLRHTQIICSKWDILSDIGWLQVIMIRAGGLVGGRLVVDSWFVSPHSVSYSVMWGCKKWAGGLQLLQRAFGGNCIRLFLFTD